MEAILPAKEVACFIAMGGDGQDRRQHPKPVCGIPEDLIGLAREKGYGKICLKVPGWMVMDFLSAGFTVEAEIPGFFQNGASACFISFYIDPERAMESDADIMKDILKSTSEEKAGKKQPVLPESCRLRQCSIRDLPAMAGIFRTVFASYPFPIHDTGFLMESMTANVCYFGIEHEGRLVALSSAEMDHENSAVEMTDFAVLEAFRGHGFAGILLERMETECRKKGVRTAFTIARALSPGINLTFSRSDYRYAGRLKNNTRIAGRIESMNVWGKAL